MPLKQALPLAHSAMSPTTLFIAIGAAGVLLVVTLLALIAMRKFSREQSARAQADWTMPALDAANPSAFMTASMQGVIEKLRAQEKELARLHAQAQQRAQESERLTEEVTRNMPTGLLLVNATGAISSTNPAAEDALGIRALRYRGYKEILGADSDLTHMLTACIRDGKTFQRGEIEHMTPEGEVRHLGVTISPIYRTVRAPLRALADPVLTPAAERNGGGALCLM